MVFQQRQIKEELDEKKKKNPKLTLIHSFVEGLALSSGQQRSIACLLAVPLSHPFFFFVIERKTLRPVLRLLLLVLLLILFYEKGRGARILNRRGTAF